MSFSVVTQKQKSSTLAPGSSSVCRSLWSCWYSPGSGCTFYFWDASKNKRETCFIIILKLFRETCWTQKLLSFHSFRETCSLSKKRKTRREILSEKRIYEEYQKLGPIRYIVKNIFFRKSVLQENTKWFAILL